MSEGPPQGLLGSGGFGGSGSCCRRSSYPREAHRRPAGGRPAQVPTGSPFADAFHLLLQEVVPPRSPSGRCAAAEPGPRGSKRSGSGSSPESRWLPWTRGLARASWSSFRASWKTARRPAGFAPSGAAGGRARDLSLGDPRKKWRGQNHSLPGGRKPKER